MQILAKPGPVVVLGATGYIGKAVVRELLQRGRPTIAFVRQGSNSRVPELEGATIVKGDVILDRGGHLSSALTGASGVISCLSSRSGSPEEVWQIDYAGSKLALDLLNELGDAGAAYVLLSAVCVKTPVLQLHRAKLAMEQALANSGTAHAVVRPSAYFKSISKQVPNVVAGKPYVLWGDGTHTRCNAIGQRDLAALLVDCLDDAHSLNRVVEIGGPGSPVTPLEQSQLIFREAGLEPKYVRVPLGWLDAITGTLEATERAVPDSAFLRDFAEYARISRFYATVDMIGPSDPQYGREQLAPFYAQEVRLAKDDECKEESLGLPASSLLASLMATALPVTFGLVLLLLSPVPNGIGTRGVLGSAVLAYSELFQRAHL